MKIWDNHGMDECFAFETDMGWICLAWTIEGLCKLQLQGDRPRGPLTGRSEKDPPWLKSAVDGLKRFLRGEAPYEVLLEIPLDFCRTTPFQKKVLEVLYGTLPGQTLTYGQLAFMAGCPGGARAVGNAVARNPLPIIVPCHRVVASNGPGGFSMFGSLESKERLLSLEGRAHSMRSRSLVRMGCMGSE